MFERILVLCTANICRSPIAEAMLERALCNKAGSIVYSAGTVALAGDSAAPGMKEVMRKEGYDISAHRAQQATEQLLGNCDVILFMDRSQLDWLDGNFPQFRGRAHRILKWQEERDVPDPYGGPSEAYEEAFRLIRSGVNDWLGVFRSQ